MVPPEGEHLTTGWEADLPPEDTLVRQAVLAHASRPVLVAGAAGGHGDQQRGGPEGGSETAARSRTRSS